MLTSLLAFLVAATVLIVAPGPDNALVLRNAIRYGARPGGATALGTLTGLSIWVLAATAGIAALIHASEIGYTVLRYAGAAYLLWLGARSLMAGRLEEPDGPLVAERERLVWRSYLVGLTTNLLNPKIGVFFLAFLPAFVPAGSSVAWVSAFLGAVFVVETAAWLFLVLFLAGTLFDLLRRPTVRRRLEQVTGTVLIGFAARLALPPS